MKTIIHIGQHKTATTSIQYYLQKNRQEFAQQGLYVPDSIAGFNNPSHFILNVYSLDNNRFSSMKEKLITEKSTSYFKELHQLLEIDIAKHYQQAKKQGCNEVIWSNEGLYLLNSVAEYKKLLSLFLKHSREIICVCCFREVASYRKSYMNQLKKTSATFSTDKDSYRYINKDSWLFNYPRKKKILHKVFGNNVIYIPYDSENMVTTFFSCLDYSTANTDTLRLNIS